jgi:hypothetical protein
MPDRKMRNQKFLEIPQQTYKSKTKLNMYVNRETFHYFHLSTSIYSLSLQKTEKGQNLKKKKKITAIHYKPSDSLYNFKAKYNKQ